MYSCILDFHVSFFHKFSNRVSLCTLFMYPIQIKTSPPGLGSERILEFISSEAEEIREIQRCLTVQALVRHCILPEIF